MTTAEQEPATEPTEEPAEKPVPPVDDDPDEEDEGVNAEQDAPEPEAQQPDVAGMSMEELEKVRTQLDRSATTWRRRVSDLLGEEATMLVPCELCDPLIPGFHFPAELEQPRDELHAHLLDVLRTPSTPDYMQAQHVRRCGTCDGWGRVLSGSRVAGKGEVSCPHCKGSGFVGDGTLPAATTAPTGNGEVEFPADATPLVVEDADPWGSPRLLPDGQENPNYGKMPQFKVPTLP